MFYLSVSSPLCVLGTYIRTSDGRIFAIRAANKAKTGEESTPTPKSKMIYNHNRPPYVVKKLFLTLWHYLGKLSSLKGVILF